MSENSKLRPLRPRQEKALAELRQAIAEGHRRVMLQAPTGFGKTLTAAHIIAGALAKGKRVAFVVPKIVLVDQTVEAFRAEGLSGISVKQGKRRGNDLLPLQVCTAQTLARRGGRLDVDIAIIDEAHIKSEFLFRLMVQHPEVIFIGLSATPWATGLGRHYSKLIVAGTTAELIDEGLLSKFTVFAPTPEPDLSGVKTTAGDFNQGDLAEAVNKPKLVADVVATWMRLGAGLPTIAYGVDRAHAEHICARFVEAGVRAEYLDCFTRDDVRDQIIARFKSGETQLIANVGILTAGFDADVRCVIDAKPTKSEMLYVQTLGRGLRTASGKEKLVVLDHAGNALRLGLVTDIHHEELDDTDPKKASLKKREKKDPLPRLCPECKSVVPHSFSDCPECGAEMPKPPSVTHQDGELVEFGSGQSSAARVTMADKARFYGELRGYCVGRDFKNPDGWCAHKFRERFGVWPNDARVKYATPRPPSVETRNWIKSRQIAFAKARDGHRRGVAA